MTAAERPGPIRTRSVSFRTRKGAENYAARWADVYPTRAEVVHDLTEEKPFVVEFVTPRYLPGDGIEYVVTGGTATGRVVTYTDRETVIADASGAQRAIRTSAILRLVEPAEEPAPAKPRAEHYHEPWQIRTSEGDGRRYCAACGDYLDPGPAPTLGEIADLLRPLKEAGVTFESLTYAARQVWGLA